MKTTTTTATATTKPKTMTLSLSLSPPSPDEVLHPGRRDSLFAPSLLSPPYQDYDAVSPLTIPSSSPFIPPPTPTTKPQTPNTSLPSPPTTPTATASPSPPTTRPPSPPLFPTPKPKTLATTPLYTPFDRHTPSFSTTPFHGFFTLLWIAVFFFVVKVSADNYIAFGHPLGGNEILRGLMMSDHHRPWELLVLAAADLGMCAATGVTFLVARGGRWDGMGWGLQVVSSFFFFFGLGWGC